MNSRGPASADLACRHPSVLRAVNSIFGPCDTKYAYARALRTIAPLK